MKIVYVIILVSFICFSSCRNEEDKYTLEDMGSDIEFIIDSKTKNCPKALFQYQDKEGNEFVVFQNLGVNELLFYDLKTNKLSHEIIYDVEGVNGVGFMQGFFILNMDSIFLTSRNIEEIYLTDVDGNVKHKYFYGETKKGLTLATYRSMSFFSKPACVLDNKLFIMPSCNRRIDPNPMCVTVDLDTDDVNELSLCYPKFENANNELKRAGVELDVSRCFNGKNFIYSFFYDEDLYLSNIDHDLTRKIKVKSRYFDKVIVPDDYGNVTIENICEFPNYGNIFYDKYRNVYYRIAYPKTTVEKNIKPLELFTYGRRVFSIIVLDENFNILTEKLFPEYTYNSSLIFVGEKGLYISKSHYLNPEFSDDELVFSVFNLKKQG